MGSFTSLVSKQLLHALFPSGAASGVSNLTPQSAADNTGGGFRIYNQAAAGTSSAYGIYAGTSLTTVAHRIDLILGSNSTLTLNTGLSDAYIGSNTLLAPAGGGASAGTITFPSTATYAGYKGMTFTGAAQGNHTWTGWTVQSAAETSNPIGSWRVDSVGQIGFPTNNTSTVYAWGFTLSACGKAADGVSPAINSNVGAGAGELDMPFSSTALLTTAPAAARPVIFAYGDLSAGRAINSGDTPVFTTGAIKITLD